jgi:hypothetical protein
MFGSEPLAASAAAGRCCVDRLRTPQCSADIGRAVIRHKAWRVVLAGGAGGAVNAALCYLKLPVPVQESTQAATFHWHIIPAGLAHGAILALVAIVAFAAAERRTLMLAVSATPVVAWCASYASWVPLRLSISGDPLLRVLIWPVEEGPHFESTVLGPLSGFGGVAGLLYLFLLLAGRAADRRPVAIVLAGLAGALGSLWWWVEWETWYFSVLHGSVWGCLVGLALAWKSRAAEQGVSGLLQSREKSSR